MEMKTLSRFARPVAGSALVLGMMQVALFAQESAKPAQAGSSASVLSKTESEARTESNYWTEERMAAAKPMPLPKVERSSIQPQTLLKSAPEPMKFGPGGRPTIQLQSEELAGPEAAATRFPLDRGEAAEETSEAVSPETTPFSYELPFNDYRTGINNQYPYTTVGKLFFTIPQGASEPAGDYVCSGSVALDNHTVLTARHCMYDISSRKWYGNWTFYPGWNNGSNSALGGGWKVNFAYTWTTNGSGPTWYWDIGFLSMHDSTGTGCGGDKGKVIGNYTGWLGWTYGGDYTQRQWNIFGYPQASPFEGNYLYQDNGATGIVNPLGNTGIVEVGNPQTGGTSGGPWIIGFNPNDAKTPTPNNNTFNAFNLANGVNSFQWTNPSEPLAINGPEFNSNNFETLYTDYGKVACK